mmetsp:Transcript_7596/g.13443  ORF Transcript_7596/g.13443 Transcript_7596/m.13443 type:complete len:90 (-) Transcript_7596:741-1010(-)
MSVRQHPNLDVQQSRGFSALVNDWVDARATGISASEVKHLCIKCMDKDGKHRTLPLLGVEGRQKQGLIASSVSALPLDAVYLAGFTNTQ